MENNGFPKFQYSVFCKNGKDSQYVVRSNDETEFWTMVDKLNAKVGGKPAQTAMDEPPVQRPASEGGCPVCGDNMTLRSGVSKKSGKPYKAKFCASGDTSHTIWL